MLSKWTLKEVILFLVGGIIYYMLETVYKGNSHWTMFVLGGLAFVCMDKINEYFPWDMPLVKQCGISTVIILILEFCTGCVVNIWLKWDVWHYEILDILGQISLPYACIWYLLSAVGIVLADYLRWKLFNEERPRYRLF